jgi:hypothetical protein
MTTAETRPSSLRLGLWGGVAGGKTTFLAALKTAMLRDPVGGWSIVGQGDPDIRFLVDQQNDLDAGKFPPGTSDPSEYRFHIGMPSARPWADAKRTAPHAAGAGRMFDLEVHDYPGTAFRDGAGDAYLQQLSDFLFSCAGLLYLYDPTSNENFKHFQETLQKLSSRMREQGRSKDNRVPQFLAVCITKYDDADVLARLQEAGLVVMEIVNGIVTPTVSDPRLAFRTLAEPSDANLPPSIRDYFIDGRVEYFAVSSVGFYSARNDGVRLEDCCNVVDTVQGARIRGRFTPVNILKPLQWLESRIGA